MGTSEATEPDPVGLLEIAERLGVARQTPRMWHHRGLLPAPRWTVSGMPAWEWADVAEWARSTGRIATVDGGTDGSN
jgi:predicted site-specific integrase-resolvase